MTKRVNKTEEELRAEVEQKQKDAFLKDYDGMTHELAVKHGYQLIPAMVFHPHRGLTPGFDITKVAIKIPNEKTDTPTGEDNPVSS